MTATCTTRAAQYAQVGGRTSSTRTSAARCASSTPVALWPAGRGHRPTLGFCGRWAARPAIDGAVAPTARAGCAVRWGHYFCDDGRRRQRRRVQPQPGKACAGVVDGVVACGHSHYRSGQHATRRGRGRPHLRASGGGPWRVGGNTRREPAWSAGCGATRWHRQDHTPARCVHGDGCMLGQQRVRPARRRVMPCRTAWSVEGIDDGRDRHRHAVQLRRHASGK
jgi:hypothetical protein